MSQQIEAVHPGHTHVEHHAADFVSIARLEKGLRGLERLDAVADGHQEVAEGTTQGGVVVHNADHARLSSSHAPLPALRRRGRLDPAPILGSAADPRLPDLRLVRTGVNPTFVGLGISANRLISLGSSRSGYASPVLGRSRPRSNRVLTKDRGWLHRALALDLAAAHNPWGLRAGRQRAAVSTRRGRTREPYELVKAATRRALCPRVRFCAISGNHGE